MVAGTILDDRSRLIDLYEACLQQDAHIRSVIETLESQILGDRYMLARINEKGKYIKDVGQTQLIQRKPVRQDYPGDCRGKAVRLYPA